MSILVKVLELGSCGKRAEALRLMHTEMQRMVMEISGIASRYPKADLPMVITALRLTTQGLENVVGQHGRNLAEKMMEGSEVTTVMVNVDEAELARQMEEEKK